MSLYVFFLFIFGLIIGSFLNVVIFRYNEGKNLFDFRLFRGRSHCLSCKKQLHWFELVPIISFLIQGGRCRTCGIQLSWQYPLVEFFGGLIFLLPFYLYSPIIPYCLFIIQSIIWILVFLIFLIIWSIDYRLYLIPDELNISIALLGFFRILADNIYNQFNFFHGSYIGSFAALFGFRQDIWLNHFLGAVAGILIVGLIVLLTRGRGMGMGDLKLLGAIGFLFGWPDVIFIFAAAVIIGSVVSILLMIFSKKTMKSFIPFGPFLVLGASAIFFFGEEILRAYFNFFGI